MAKKKGKTKKNPGGDFVVRSRVKEAFSKAKCNSSADVTDALNEVVGWYVQQAAKRAKANKRKTVRGYDIMVG